MQYVLRILRRHLANEFSWLRSESLASIDRKYGVGASMAKQRIPQLEHALKILGDVKWCSTHGRADCTEGVCAQAPDKDHDRKSAESPADSGPVDASQLGLFKTP